MTETKPELFHIGNNSSIFSTRENHSVDHQMFLLHLLLDHQNCQQGGSTEVELQYEAKPR